MSSAKTVSTAIAALLAGTLSEYGPVGRKGETDNADRDVIACLDDDGSPSALGSWALPPVSWVPQHRASIKAGGNLVRTSYSSRQLTKENSDCCHGDDGCG